MAGTITLKSRTSPRESAERQLLVEHNRLVTDVETLRAAVVALATAATQSASVSAIALASSMTAAQIGRATDGTPFAE